MNIQLERVYSLAYDENHVMDSWYKLYRIIRSLTIQCVSASNHSYSEKRFEELPYYTVFTVRKSLTTMIQSRLFTKKEIWFVDNNSN